MDDLKLALIVNAVSPVVGGVLLRGEKGTAKSTVVRALAALLPDVAVIEGCRFSCAPSAPDAECPDGPHRIGGSATTRSARLVELPVGASEDRVVGSLDLERALTEGVRAYQPGLLAAAHRGVLYVDEVNLLHDHLVDLLLDAAALGTSYVERDGVSVRHAARFLLVGTMNPEEGELRPQLLDRFGLNVEVAASRDPGERAQVVRRRLDYEADPDGFAAAWSGEDAALADLVTARAAVALAAWAGRDAVTAEDVRQAALLALPHRRRRNPFDAPGLDEQQLDEVLADAAGPDDEPPPGGGQPSSVSSSPTESDGREPASSPPGAGDSAPSSGSMAPPPEQAPVSAGTPYRVRTLTAARTAARTAASIRADPPAGRRGRSTGDPGRTIRARRPTGRLSALHLTATVASAAPHQRARGRRGPGIVLHRDDLREPVRAGREGNLVLFVVDASGSMAARQRMRAVKEAALSLLVDAYQRRDRVGMVTFRGTGAEVVLPPTSSVEVGAARLAALPTGGRTPLAAGLLRAAEVLRVERMRDPRRRPLVVLLTDGRATAGGDAVGDALRAADHLARSGVASVVVDCESGPVRLGLAPRLAVALGGECLRLDELAADAISGLVRPIGPRRAA